MNVRKIDKNQSAPVETKQKTHEQLQNEYDYILAQRVLKAILEEGLITIDEFNKITEMNRKCFSPDLAVIMP